VVVILILTHRDPDVSRDIIAEGHHTRIYESWSASYQLDKVKGKGGAKQKNTQLIF
jgi:hypothetical protein